MLWPLSGCSGSSEPGHGELLRQRRAMAEGEGLGQGGGVRGEAEKPGWASRRPLRRSRSFCRVGDRKGSGGEMRSVDCRGREDDRLVKRAAPAQRGRSSAGPGRTSTSMSHRWSEPELKPLVSESSGLVERDSRKELESRRPDMRAMAGNFSMKSLMLMVSGVG